MVNAQTPPELPPMVSAAFREVPVNLQRDNPLVIFGNTSVSMNLLPISVRHGVVLPVPCSLL